MYRSPSPSVEVDFQTKDHHPPHFEKHSWEMYASRIAGKRRQFTVCCTPWLVRLLREGAPVCELHERCVVAVGVPPCCFSTFFSDTEVDAGFM